MAYKIEKLQRDFLWGDSKTHLLGWDKVCAYCQWLWRRVVAFKFGEELGGGCSTSKLGRGVHECGL